MDNTNTHLCLACDAEFVVESIEVDEPPSFCPFCGSELEFEDEDYDEEDE